MKPQPEWLSKIATVYSGPDWRKQGPPMAHGRVVAYIDGPSVLVENPDGSHSTWPTSLPIDFTDPEPEPEYDPAELGVSTAEVLDYLADPDNLWRRTALAPAINLDPQEAK